MNRSSSPCPSSGSNSDSFDALLRQQEAALGNPGNSRPLNFSPADSDSGTLIPALFDVGLNLPPRMPRVASPSPTLLSAPRASVPSGSETNPTGEGRSSISITQRDTITTTVFQSDSTSSPSERLSLVGHPPVMPTGVTNNLTQIIAAREDIENILVDIRQYLESRSNREENQYLALERLISTQKVLILTTEDIKIVQANFQQNLNAVNAYEASIGRPPRTISAICEPYKLARETDISRIQHLNLNGSDKNILFMMLQTSWLREELRLLQNDPNRGDTLRMVLPPEVAFSSVCQLNFDSIKLSSLQEVRSCCDAVFATNAVTRANSRIKIMKHFELREDYSTNNILSLVSDFNEYYEITPDVFVFSTLSSQAPHSKGVMVTCYCGIRQKEYRMHDNCSFCGWLMKEFHITPSQNMVIVMNEPVPLYKGI